METRDLETLSKVLKPSLMKASRGQPKVGLSSTGHILLGRGTDRRGKHNSMFACGAQMDNIKAKPLY